MKNSLKLAALAAADGCDGQPYPRFGRNEGIHLVDVPVTLVK